jgi:hypothetical protein
LYVLLNIDPSSEPERPHDREYDRTSELIATLREQLEAERQAHAEARSLLMAALERIPPQLEQLEAPAPPDERESPETLAQAEETPEMGQPHPDSEAAEAQRDAVRPWWRRLIPR